MPPTAPQNVAPSPDRFASVDSLRGVCAVLVALGHWGTRSHYTAGPFFAQTFLLVDFFFVLSGFVLAWSYDGRLHSPADWRSFAILRIGRLWPLHATMLGAFIALETFQFWFYPFLFPRPAFGPTAPLDAIATNLFLLHATPLDPRAVWNVPSWSVSSELWTCLAFATLCVLRWDSSLTLTLLGIGAALVFYFKPGPNDLQAVFFWMIARASAGFFMGVLCARAMRRFGRLKLSALAATCMEAATITAIGLLLGLSAGWTPLIVVLSAACVWMFAHERGMLSRLLRWAPLIWIGTLSYSIYLVHFIVPALMHVAANFIAGRTGYDWRTSDGRYGRDPLESALLIAAFLILTIVLSVITHRMVEAPSRNFSRRLARRVAPQ